MVKGGRLRDERHRFYGVESVKITGVIASYWFIPPVCIACILVMVVFYLGQKWFYEWRNYVNCKKLRTSNVEVKGDNRGDQTK